MSINFDNKYFIEAPTTLQGDLSSLINNSTEAYVLAESQDDQTTALARKTRWDNVVNGTNSAIGFGMSSLAVISGICMFVAIAMLIMTIGLDETPYLVPALGFAILTGVCSYFSNRLFQAKKNQFFIDISNYNDECYQFRFMPDNKLYILVGANFDEKGDTLATNAIVELEPVCSDILIMDRIYHIKRFDEGVAIRGKATIKSYRITNGLRRYMQLDKPQYVTLFLQEGIYPKEILERISKSYGIKFL